LDGEAAGVGQEEKRRKGERNKGRSKVSQPEQERKGVQVRPVTTTTDPAMYNNVQLAQSLCRRGGSNKDGFQEKSGKKAKKISVLGGARAVVLKGRLPMRRPHFGTCSSCQV